MIWLLNFSTAPHRHTAQTAKTWEDVKAVLEEKAEKFAVWARWNGLAMNAGKTQLLVSSNAGPTSGLTVRVGNNDIKCSETLELLGVGYDRKLSAAPHADNMIKAAKQRAALISRLANQIPRGRYLRQLAGGRVLGKTGHALAAVAKPRLTADTLTNGKLKAVQVAFNNVCRSITGNKRSDRVKVADLSKEANLPTVNELITC
jgi:hypothetical protein